MAETAEQWLTDEILGLLRAIKQPHAEKKRRTVIKLAFARANQQPLATVFMQPDVCAERIWWQKWQHLPDVKAAFEACYKRALDWADQETASLEAFYRRQRRQSTAKYAAQAPAALAAVMAGAEQRGADRISAADMLMRWAEPDTGAKLGRTQPAGSIEQTVNVAQQQELNGLSDDGLEQLISNLKEATGGGHAGEAAAGDGGAGPADVDNLAPADAGPE
jgi:hypothetical protein